PQPAGAERGRLRQRGAPPTAPVYPQIINTFHIASSFGKWFEGSDQAFPNTSALAGISPVLHSFRVFDVRHKSNKDYLNSDGSAKSSCVSKDVPNNVDLSKFDGFVLYGKRKPILMCFLCKLSFGYVRSFVTHAVHDHRMTLSEEERKILSNKNISAIIQGIGKDKEPLTLSRGTASTSSNSASSFVFDGANRRNHLSFNNEGSGASVAEGSRRLDFIDESANKDNATAPEPNESTEGEDGSYVYHHQHAGPLCELGGGECPSGSGVECPKCDTVLGSSRSLGGHMTMMHSRNSCKTLKCPKCNWHYKYQQTLEAHMKEKHPEPGGSCVYCKSGQPHPRLARGESYTCGYKPFRCEVCNYSTTTKGNLSIHMQSDKHLNNMQNLQNGGGEQVFSHTAGAAAAAGGAPPGGSSQHW
ncbi:PREDICTED: zinc finger homeobox protein 3-like, partial [Pygoscelis adeliae]|uniref:zinc finger homeobox protein 3-like n=1 Tax=Pygoscelis adeliae TaxID=9238 RepID=UPI0004F5056A